MTTVHTPDTPGTAPVYRLTIASDDGTEIGHVYVYIIGDLARQGKRYALIDHMAIEEPFQDKGYGKKLLTAAEEVAHKEQCYKMVLYSRMKNHRAHAFYIKQGYSFWGHEFRKDLTTTAP